MIARLVSVIRAIRLGCVLFLRAKAEREQLLKWRLSND